jgi:two-component system osmolarity sensor histidine kinase EnvZ
MALSDHLSPARLAGHWSGLLGAFRQLASGIADRIGNIFLPKGLYTRTVLIMIMPIVLLEGVVAFVFMERHWQSVTRRLSEATARDLAAVIDLYRNDKGNDDYAALRSLSRDRLNISLQILPPGELPPAQPKPFFALLDRTLTDEISARVKDVPFWIDTVGNSRHVEIKFRLENAILRFVATRSQTYASNSHIFLIWMVATSVVLLTVAILFLRNQIRPILRLAEAADSFGKGRPVDHDLTPRGALEIRKAAIAFNEMRERITQHVEQRTAMLAGVSHDLRTVLTRLKLELALVEETPEIRAMQQDVNEMQHMLEEYLAFAKGDGGENARPTRLRALLEEIVKETQLQGMPVTFTQSRRRRELIVPLKRNAFKRTITNLVGNANRFADKIVLRCYKANNSICVVVEDNGPGIPPHERENVFRPFYRLDHARNQDKGNTGLGLAIARDIARTHGGDITLETSQLGGLLAKVQIPL